MIPDNLKHYLSSRYKILKFIDLADLISTPTLGYQVFKEGHKPSFDANERFVFYTNSHVGNKTISYLQHAADMFDVSRCFILICCPSHESINVDFDLEFFTAKLNECKPFDDCYMISTESLCVLPWMHLEIMNGGEIRACCYSKELLGNIKNKDLDEAFNDDNLTSLRESLLRGERPSNCDTCWERESKGVDSLRQWRNKSHKEYFFTNLLNQPDLKSIVLRPSTVCNFKCRICGPTCSSLWAQEDLLHAVDKTDKNNLLKIISDGKWANDDLELFNDILKLIPNLEFIDLYGGEPLLIKYLKRIIEESINTGSSKKQRLHFNTNASLFPDDIISLMEGFREVTVSLSIDDIGQRFEITRGGNWIDIENNIDRFLACNPEIFKVSVLVTVSNLNLLYLDELINWANEKNLPLTFNMLHYPEYLKFDRITKNVKDIVLQKYTNHCNPFLKTIADSIEKITPTDSKEWLAQMQKLDYRRNQNLLDSHRLLAENMGYSVTSQNKH